MAEGGAHLPQISPPGKLDLYPHPVEQWKLWKQMWDNYSIVAKLNEQSEHYKTALFLHCVGPEALKIYNGFQFTDEENRNDLETVLSKFDQHIIGQTNETYERYVFNQRDQDLSENIDSYVTTLRYMAKTCSFCNCLHDSLIRDRVVLGCKDNHTRKRLLQQGTLTLKQCIDICRSTEATATQLKVMGGQDDTVNKVSNYKSSRQRSKGNNSSRQKFSPGQIDCKFCGRRHEKKKEKCPAWGQTCNTCGVENHFSPKCPNKTKCKQNKVHSLLPDNNTDSSDTDFVYNIKPKGENNEKTRKDVHVELLIGEQSIKFQVDSGATVNVLPVKYVPNTKLEPYDKQLQMWNGSNQSPLGKCRVVLRNPRDRKKYSVEFIIVNQNHTPILSKRASEQMGFITINYENFNSVASLNTSLNCDNILLEYSDVFTGELGTLPGKVHLRVDETVTPETSAPGRVPIALKTKLKTELNRLQALGVIIPVDEPTDWNSRLVVATKKSGDIRLCIDPKPLNAALKRERFQLPVIDDILPRLSKAKFFTKLDLTSGYWHVALDYDSSLLTTFQTGYGRYRWLRLPFGLSVSSEIFQKRLLLALDGLEGVICVADDIIVYGSGDETEKASIDHDNNLKCLLQRCREKGIKLNPKKSEIRKTEITFLGHLITQNGLKIDPTKVEAITELKPPTNVEEVQRLNGMVNYLAKFLPQLSTVIEPIRQLTRKDTQWNWSSVHDKAFQEVKRLVTEAPLLLFYEPETDLVIQCDASEKGLGAALLQNGKPIAYASRALTDTETRYAQIEKEMLAIVYSLEKFHQYTYGRHTIVHSDHKPLEAIIKKPLVKAPKRLQGMLLRAQQYDISIIYTKGKEMYLADMLSRSFLPNTDDSQKEFERVNMVSFLPIREEKLKRLRQATELDDVTCSLRQVILQGWPDDKDQLASQLIPYYHSRDEMSVQDGLIFKGERVLVPLSLRNDVKRTIHSSHIGIDGCLRRARECIFWPGMTAEIREYISTCETCRKFDCDQPKETLMAHDIPDRPWQKVGVDLFCFDDKDYLVTVDYFSNFWEMDRLEDTTTSTVIHKLKGHFARYGIPCQVISDPGPQFTSTRFQHFSEKWDFEHLLVSPANQKANGKAESAVKSAKRLLRKNKDANSDPFIALLDFRNTPTQGVGNSPAQRLMNRRTRTLLPMTSNLLKPTGSETNNKQKLQKKQDKQVSYYNKSAHDLPILNEGETVRMRPYIKGRREWQKAVVTERLDERSYRVETPNGVYRRNRAHLRKSKEIPPDLTIRNTVITMDLPVNPTTHKSRHNPIVDTPRNLPPKTNHDKTLSKQPISTTQPIVSRSGRPVKKPSYLKDFVN